MPVWCVARPTAAPCGHFAALPLVRSTFGLRGYPPLRFGAFPHFALAVKQAHDALNQSPCGIRRETPARGFGRSSLVVCRRVIFNLFGCSLGEPSTESSCGVGATEDETSTRAVVAALIRSKLCVSRIRDLRSQFPHKAPGTKRPNCLVAFATIRDPPG